MALTTLLPSETNTTTHHHHHHHHHHRRRKKKPPPPPPPPPRTTTTTTTSSSSSSWSQLKSLLSCGSSSSSAQVHDPSTAKANLRRSGACGPSLCAFRTAAAAAASECGSAASSLPETAPLAVRRRHHQVAAAPGGLRGLSGCYECRAVAVEHAGRYPGRPRAELCTCPACGEVFTKAESLEHHQLGPEDSGRNIVEIIFKSSWHSRGVRRRPTCQIERILKVHNTPRTLARFESYRDAVRLHARSAAATASTRAAADGNELLRFHSARLLCPLGIGGSSALCTASASGACSVCAAIRHGLTHRSDSHPEPLGVRTTASSGRAHDCDRSSGSLPSAVIGRTSWAMLVCRVIAGSVRRPGDPLDEPHDSVAAGDCDGTGGNLEELFVANPRAILPCFVVIYRILE
ncbi:hypothetical protein ACMD2_02352 [Ananas comosus]|uniref:C2H2-type domain-containing protein n=1 Tax=Ananas comosus TaxID=4615 RepID=A0A199VC91_ANACO|nr:hypothetical protein ACMD2_02352 [Ananas comosus]